MNNKLFFKTIYIALVLILTFATNCFATDSMYVWSNHSSIITTNAKPTEITTNPSTNSLNLESGAAILIDQGTGQILYEHNIHEQLKPASVTKVMSILLIMEAIDSGSLSLTDQISCSEHASSMGGSQIWLDPTETLTVDEMLKAICVVSANDCTVAMAEHISGSESAFVDKMNARAKELGMNDTTFKNCHGIDEDGHVTSAYDISLMSRELLSKHPTITNYTTIWMDNLRDGKSELVNTNKLVRNYKGATGLKTGSTSLALYNLSASATRDDLSLIAVIMKAPSTKVRFAEAQKLLDYGFANYSSKNFGNKNEIIKTVNVSKGVTTTVNAVLEENASILVKKGQEASVTQDVYLPDIIYAPVYKGDIIGYVEFKMDNQVIKKVNIISDSEVKSANLWNITTNLYKTWFNMLRV